MRWALEAAVLVMALAAIAFGLFRLRASVAGLERTDDDVAGTPVTVLAPAGTARAPTVVVAHGFAGSRELMQAFTTTLAQSGYVVVAFDFPGHGDHPKPLGGTLGSDARTASLLAALQDVVVYARQLERGDGRVALVGHSMAGDILVQHASNDPSIAAVVGLSPYLAEAPSSEAIASDLLLAYGGLEPDLLMSQGRAAVAEVADDVAPRDVEPGRTYGTSTKRQLVVVEGAEHIGILFSPGALEASVAWLDAAWDRDRPGPAPTWPRRAGLAAWYLGVVLLGFGLARRLPVVSTEARPSGPRGRRFWAAALVPAVGTPVVLTPVPTDFLPSILTDHLALHLAVYGLFTAFFLGRAGLRAEDVVRGLRPRAFAIALGAVLVFELVLLGCATDRFLASFFPGPNRVVATGVALVGSALWFIADETLCRSPDAPRGAYATTKVLFVGSLVLGVVLNPSQLFFLVLIIPAIIALFVVYGLLGTWIGQRTGHPLVAALAHALAFALVISATFPVVE